MSIASTEAMAAAAEQRAEDAERSPLPTLLRIGRVVVWIVWAVVLVTAILLLLAFFLRLGGANPEAGFVQWVERSVERAMGPFRGIFPTRELTGDSVLDTSLLFAAIVYFVIALLVDALLRWLTARLQRTERETARLRAEADQRAGQAAGERQAHLLAAQRAAAQEAARQQAAAQQYAVAQAAAEEALAQQAARDAIWNVQAVPSEPVAAPVDVDEPLVPPPPTDPPVGGPPA